MYQMSSQSQWSWYWDTWFSRPLAASDLMWDIPKVFQMLYPSPEVPCDNRTSWSLSVFSIVCMSWAGSDQRTGRRSQTGEWRGHSPACGSSPPWRWYGSNRRRRLLCSTAPTRRPPQAAWRGRRGGSTAAGQVHKLSTAGGKQDRPTFQPDIVDIVSGLEIHVLIKRKDSVKTLYFSLVGISQRKYVSLFFFYQDYISVTFN